MDKVFHETESVNETIEHLCECIKNTKNNDEKVRLTAALASLISARAKAHISLLHEG